MFALNLMAMASEPGWFNRSTLGWMVIVIAWTIIGAVWMAANLLSQRASQSNGLVRTDNSLRLVLHKWRIESKPCGYDCYSRPQDISER